VTKFKTEAEAERAWKDGSVWHGYYKCCECGEVTICRGRSRSRVYCLPCFKLVSMPRHILRKLGLVEA
jgi:hypothetical protein